MSVGLFNGVNMTATIINFKTGKLDKKERKCSFCNKSESEVRSLVEAETTRKCICNECIIKCRQFIGDQNES